MAASRRRSDAASMISLTELSLDLAGLDLKRPAKLGDRVVAVFAQHLATDRVSLLLLNPSGDRPERAFTKGFSVAEGEWGVSQKLIDQVRRLKEPLLVYDIRQQPEMLAPWADDYRSDAFALLPLVQEHQVVAVLCVSNLSAQHLMQMENSLPQLELLLAQLRQLYPLLAEIRDQVPQEEEPVSGDELSIIGSLNERLDQTMDVRNVFAIFAEIIGHYVPIEVMAVIHGEMHERQRGVICVTRPVHRTELDGVFNSLAHQWQRRHKRAPLLDCSEARIVGAELVQDEGECPAELRLGRAETFPVFIDNDLFALVSLATDEETLLDRRRLRVFDILLHHLMLHVKKGLLLAQNQEMQTVDALTGLYNERHFYQMMEREFDRAARYNVPLSLLIIDVDHFKDVNETYGFETGDMLLQEISRIMMENIRTTDIVSRYSGERFVLVLPETHYKNAEIMANRLRRFIENNSFFIPNTNVFIKVTVSIGVASYLEHKPASLAQFIEFADTALYFAKRGGRNKVVGYSFVINLMMRDTEHES